MNALEPARPLIIAALLALPSLSLAMDLAQAYRLALANDSQVASARLQLGAVRERLPQAEAAFRPQVNSSASLQQQNGEIYPATGPSRSTQFTNQNYAISLSYPIYRAQNVEVLEQSRLQIAVAEAQLAAAAQDLVLRVSQAYFDVLASQDNVATIGSQKRAITEQLAAAKRNFEVGTATITDQQEAQARFDLAVAQELAALNDLEVRRAALSLLVGRSIPAIATLRPGIQLSPPQPAQETRWTGAARETNYSVQQARLNSEIAKREIERQRVANNVTVDLVSSLAHGRSANFNQVGTNSVIGGLGVQVAKPLYTGGLIESRVKEALASHERALSDLETSRRQAELAARQAFYGVNSGLAQIRALEAAEKSSQLALDSNLLGYQVGVRINIDVLNAQQQLFTTRRDLARARYDTLLNSLRLKTTNGSLGEADIGSVNAMLVAAEAATR
jgi:outer membrane protein